LADRSFADDSTVNDIPWASVFDAAANVRALGAVQSEGFRAASEVVDRFVNFVGARNGSEAAQAGRPGSERGRNPDAAMVLAGWEGILGQFAGSIRNGLGGSPAMDFGDQGGHREVRLSAAGPGAATVEFWLHNRGPLDLGTIVLRCGDLLAHDGSVIESRSVGFEPGAVPMPARSSRGVLLSVDVPSGAPAGTYRGTVLADGHDDVWLPLVLSIEP